MVVEAGAPASLCISSVQPCKALLGGRPPLGFKPLLLLSLLPVSCPKFHSRWLCTGHMLRIVLRWLVLGGSEVGSARG